MACRMNVVRLNVDAGSVCVCVCVEMHTYTHISHWHTHKWFRRVPYDLQQIKWHAIILFHKTKYGLRPNVIVCDLRTNYFIRMLQYTC